MNRSVHRKDELVCVCLTGAPKSEHMSVCVITCVYMYIEYVTGGFSLFWRACQWRLARGCFYREHAVFHVSVAERFMGLSVGKDDPFSSVITTNNHLLQAPVSPPAWVHNEALTYRADRLKFGLLPSNTSSQITHKCNQQKTFKWHRSWLPWDS